MSKFKLKGVGTATIRRKDGSVEVFRNSNMIVDTGKDFIIKSVIMTGMNRPEPMGYVAVGGGDSPTLPTMTALVNETNRTAGQWSYSGDGVSFTIAATFPRGSVVGKITEGGVFNAQSGGVMLDRVLFSPSVELDADDEYTQEFTFTV